MPRIIRLGIDLTQGHCWPPMPAIKGSSKTFINNLPIVRVGDNYGPHPGPCKALSPHDGIALPNGSTVFVEGLPVHRDGDMISCGDAADNGSPDVFAEGLGRGGPATKKDPGQTTGYTVNIPVIEYDNHVIYYQVDPQNNFRFIRGCPVHISVKDIFTPLKEEISENVFKNYPGLPITTESGAKLPSYAPKSYEDPIAIYNFTIKNLPNGLVFNSNTGVISGALPGPLSTIFNVEVTAQNFVGTGRANFQITSLQTISKCP